MIWRALLMLVAAGAALPGIAVADQASQPASTAAAGLDSGEGHTCATLPQGRLRCWGFSGNGQLGYGNEASVGDDEAPGAVGPVDLGAGRSARAVTAGNFHSCAVLDDLTVRCWGSGLQGQLGRVQNLSDVGDNETPGSVPPVDLGPGRTALAVSGGGGHTCALLDDGNVRCWGYGYRGRLGYGTNESVGIDQSPGSVGPVDLGAGRTATAISAGNDHTCAVLDNGQVRCWGDGSMGRLGYGNVEAVGDNETPGSIAPVDLGAGRTAVAISAGDTHTCAALDNGSVRCWGAGADGKLGYGNTTNVGDNETPGSVPAVDLGPGRTAKAIAAGRNHTCAILDDGDLRCWGASASGELGLGNLETIGDIVTPGSVPPVALGAGRDAIAVSLGARHTCARLDDLSVRCWGYAGNGRLGYCSLKDIGDDEAPGTAGPVALLTRSGGGCVVPSPASPRPAPSTNPPKSPTASLSAALRAQAARLRGLRGCRSSARRHAAGETRRARRLSGSARVRARRHIRRHRNRRLRACLKRHGRTPGRVVGLKAQAASGSRIVLSFNAVGTDGNDPPAAQAYVLKQSRQPIRSQRAFRRAQTLCAGACRFPSITRVGSKLTVTVSDLGRGKTYYYAVAARDNVSRRLGPRSKMVSARTPR